MEEQYYRTNSPVISFFLTAILLLGIGSYALAQDSTKTGYTNRPIDLPTPTSIEEMYTYDPITDRYIYSQKLGKSSIAYPIVLTPEEFEKMLLEQDMQAYFKKKIDAADGRKSDSQDDRRNLLPTYYVKSELFETIFGGNTIDIIPQGNVEVDLGVLYNKQDNPSLSPRNRRNFTFDFDQRISLNLMGKVGERLDVNINYDTQSTFDFQNQIKLEYTPTEDDIIQSIEVGNVSMPLNSSLIQGAQSLFGVKTELQFGKTRVTGVFSEQKSETQTIVAEGDATVNEFKMYAMDYDDNRHFFLAHYFRDNYDQAISQYPFLNTNIEVTRIEVWVTNRSNRTDNIRSVIALQDIGESKLENIGLQNVPADFIQSTPNATPDNKNNKFNPFGISGGEPTYLNENIRDRASVESGFGGLNVRDGMDYATIENARNLEPHEYRLNRKLGYISLNERLRNDEVLAVAFQYTRGGKVYQVGEFSNDGVDNTGGQLTNPDNDGEPIVNSSQNLVVKMLRSSFISVNEPVWDLMMKNIYPLGAFDLEQEDFKLNIVYTDPSPVNYIKPAPGTTEFPAVPLPEDVAETPLLRVFNLDRLNFNNDPQQGGDGFFDFVPGITVDRENGAIIFTSVEPFGEYLFEKLRSDAGGEQYDQPQTYNANQNKYVFHSLYRNTKTEAEQQQSEKNKFQLRGTYKSTGGDGIPIGAINVPQGSVRVTAGGRTLVEGIDYTVNYQTGRVHILDPSLANSKTPINISTENNTTFGRQTRRFTGLHVEHQFNKNFMLGGTYLNMNERPMTQKSAYNGESVNNSIFGVQTVFSTEAPFLTRLVNKLPNIDTDVESHVSFRGEFAYLLPGSPKVSNFDGKTTSYIDDFEASQTSIDLMSPQSWHLASTPVGFGGEVANNNLEYNYNRAKLAWYSIDPVFYSGSRPSDVSNEDVSGPFTRRVFRDEVFPNQDIIQGQSHALFTFDLAYYPSTRGPYNFNPITNGTNNLPNPRDRFGGITRGLSTSDFVRSNVEYIQFWVMDPFIYPENAQNTGGTLSFNLGNISEDILKDGRMQYENGLPEDGGTSNTIETEWGKVPANQALVYAFSNDPDVRARQDIGLDGLSDAEEAAKFPLFAGLDDPAGDNYEYYLQANGDVLERYLNYNGTEGNSPVEVTNTNRGNTTLPDTEDVNGDNTMNTVNSYYEYDVKLFPGMNPDNNNHINDVKELTVTTDDNREIPVRWVQFKVPISEYDNAIGGISGFENMRFMRMYLSEFTENTVLRFGTLELVRGDYRRFAKAIDKDANDPNFGSTTFESGTVSIEENENREPINYVMPPGVYREQYNHNNDIIRENERALSLRVRGLEPNDGRGVYKNFNVDMRQYKNIEMFIHAESIINETALDDGDMVAFIRMGNDLTDSYYEVQIPLKPTEFGNHSPDQVWPYENRLNIPLHLLQEAKTRVYGSTNINPSEVTFFDEQELGGSSGGNQRKIGVKGNPSFGDVRVIMLGIRNSTAHRISGEVWFNELRLSELENKGGWAAVATVDANLADFASVTASGGRSTVGFGALESGPNERDKEDVKQYDVVTDVNLGQLLPEKWGIQLPFNYGRSEEKITPEYDPEFQDVKLDTRIANEQDADEKKRIENQAVDYTRRQSINFIGVRKERTGDKTPRIYDVENLTLSYSYNQVNHHDYEIEDFLDQSVRAGATYSHNFAKSTWEPFRKNDSIFKGRYWKFMKDFNVNYLPTSIHANSNIIRQYNEQTLRDTDLLPGSIGMPTLYQRNYLFDWQYTVNYDITNSLKLRYNSANHRVVKNYIDYDGVVDNSIGIWDDFFDIGEPNEHYQSLQLDYELPFNKFPFLAFIRGTYSYTSDFQWSKGSDMYENLAITGDDGTTNYYNLGNSVQNANTHRINSQLNMRTFYNYIGLRKKRASPATKRDAVGRGSNDARTGRDNRSQLLQRSGDLASARAESDAEGGSGLSFGDKSYNTLVTMLTSLRRVTFNYQENRGTYLPGYLPKVGAIGTLKPSTGFIFGSQSDIRHEAARRGWLTLFPEFNEQFTQVVDKQLDVQANFELLPDLTIDLNGNRLYSESTSENYLIENGVYHSLTPNTFGNFNISTILLGSSFKSSGLHHSDAFQDFKDSRIIVANRLAEEYYGTTNFPVDEDGYPVGFGKTSQDVLLPSFLAAYRGRSASKEKTSFLRNIPLPNWDVKYTGLMRLEWFKQNFNRFSIHHGYRAAYTINQFQTNLDYDANNPEATTQNGNFKSKTLVGNVNLTEQFTPLAKVDFEMKNDISIMAEYRKDRALSLSFANNLLTEVQGDEIVLGMGYRIRDLRIGTNFAGEQRVLRSDLNLKLDFSRRDNKTIIRYLDIDNNQTTAGQTIYGLQFTADYALTDSFTVLFYYDHTFSEYAISTAFPQTTIRSGLTLRYIFGN
ncbi:MAG TPA: cell surface protein SprA [Flavobacteriaceae bacterium]|nr:cell surface protein SprA [Flavobacteriaceae bacterium]